MIAWGPRIIVKHQDFFKSMDATMQVLHNVILYRYCLPAIQSSKTIRSMAPEHIDLAQVWRSWTLTAAHQVCQVKNQQEMLWHGFKQLLINHPQVPAIFMPEWSMVQILIYWELNYWESEANTSRGLQQKVQSWSQDSNKEVQNAYGSHHNCAYIFITNVG